MEDRKSWAVKDEAILDDLVTLMGLSEAEKTELASLKGQALAQSSGLVDAFYTRLLNQENTSEYIGGMVDHLRTTLEAWFADLFSGNYDQTYVNGRLQIGKTHVRIGLPVRYPLAMMDILMDYGERVAAQSSQPELAKAAFRKLAALDIAIFNQAYENAQLDHLSELVGNERLARRLLQK